MEMLRFWRDTRGLTAIEYVAVGALVALFLFGTLSAIFTTLHDKLQRIADGL
ncbi:MAG: Flp family type IVb pilin [Chloroflexota bacterium]|nr:MAG: Flp family type IVb pilin [Chloroflexota bacterium]